MRKRSVCLLLLCANGAAFHCAQAQTCGGEMRIVKVRQPNGQLADSLRYEVLEIPDYYRKVQDSLDAFRSRSRHGASHYPLSSYLNTGQQGGNYGQMAMVPLDSADIRYLQSRHLLAPVSERSLNIHKFVSAGFLPDGVCRFKTYETGGAVFVLKLASSSRQFYLINQLFTRCGYQPFAVI